MANRFLQAFQQAPWRIQAQRLGLIFMGLVVFGLTAGVYLSISASAYAAGFDVQRYLLHSLTTAGLARLVSRLAAAGSATMALQATATPGV